MVEFTMLPHSHPLPQFRLWNHSHDNILVLEVNSLLQKGAIEPVPTTFQGSGFYSTYFMVPKKKERWRLILDLHHLNCFIRKPKFCMVMLVAIIPS